MSMPTLDNPFRESRLGSSEDYRREWDVLALNEGITEALAEQIRNAKGRRHPDAGQMVSVLLSAPGYGKTHLFGRMGHLLAEEMFFVFVPAFEDAVRPLHHIRRFAVDSLFRGRHGRPGLIAWALTHLCRSSFLEYVGRFPPSLAARYQSFQQALKDQDGKILEVTAAVKELRPFLTLASSIAERMPASLFYPVMKALALGWSPAGHVVQRWLKGEPLSDEESEALSLGEEPAQPLDVLQGIAAILDYRLPMVICCDQIEMVLRKGQNQAQNEDIVQKLTAELIEILHRVPNQVLVLSCLEGEWAKFKDRSFEAFKQRSGKPSKLDDLSESQAVELVTNRLKGRPGRPTSQNATWPFDGASLLTYVRNQQPNPRTLIQRCAELLQDWSQDGQHGLIYFDRKIDDDPDKLFLQQWNQELEKIQSDPACNAETYDEARLYRAVKEAMTLAREAKREVGGIQIKNIQEGAIPQGGKYKRYSLKVEVADGPQPYPLLVPVTAINSGTVFAPYFTVMQQAMLNPVAGALIVHRQSDFQIGQGVTRQRYDQEVARGRIRVLAMDDDQQTFLRLECLLRFLDDAAGQLLRLGDLKLSEDDCRDFILKTSVLDNLGLFKQLAGWRRAAVPQPTPPPNPPPRPAVASAAAAGDPARSDGGMTATAVAPQPVADAAAASAAPTPPPPEPGPAPNEKFAAWAREKLVHLVKLLNALGQPVKAVEPKGFEIGPTFARLMIELASARAHFKRICDKADDLRIHLKLAVPPIIESQAGYNSVDVQLPERSTVLLRDALADVPKNIPTDDPVFPVGLDVAGAAHWLNLSDPSDCHLLVAGTTGSGKSEFLRAMVAALAMRLDPLHLQFVLIDPKQVTFNLGGDSPFLQKPVARDADQALPLLEWCMTETHRRYELLAKQKLTHVGQLNESALIPRVVVVIDEFANLLEGKESKKLLNSLLKQICSMARAAGIHLVLATQRPDKDVVTPLLRDNLPGRIALQVPKPAGSELILNSPNAAYLLGKGDLLWQRGGGV
jgi:S-DNA-T family DNA segregation ATPase FtsK/SpoIIIE